LAKNEKIPKPRKPSPNQGVNSDSGKNIRIQKKNQQKVNCVPKRKKKYSEKRIETMGDNKALKKTGRCGPFSFRGPVSPPKTRTPSESSKEKKEKDTGGPQSRVKGRRRNPEEKKKNGRWKTHLK